MDHEKVQGASNEGFVNLRVQMAGVYPKHALVYLSDDYKVTDITAANKRSIGEVMVPATAADGYGTINSRFRAVLKDVEAAGAIVVGAEVESAADSGSSGQRVQTISTGPAVGVALEAAAQAGDLIDVGLY